MTLRFESFYYSYYKNDLKKKIFTHITKKTLILIYESHISTLDNVFRDYLFIEIDSVNLYTYHTMGRSSVVCHFLLLKVRFRYRLCKRWVKNCWYDEWPFYRRDTRNTNRFLEKCHRSQTRINKRNINLKHLNRL